MDCAHGVPLPLHCGACHAERNGGMADGIAATLAERGGRYGDFSEHARIAQDLQRIMHREAGWSALAPDQRQALTVIMDKVARMLNGDPTYRDNWHDIVGYAKLVDDRMKRDEDKADNGPELPLEDPKKSDIADYLAKRRDGMAR